MNDLAPLVAEVNAAVMYQGATISIRDADGVYCYVNEAWQMITKRVGVGSTLAEAGFMSTDKLVVALQIDADAWRVGVRTHVETLSIAGVMMKTAALRVVVVFEGASYLVTVAVTRARRDSTDAEWDMVSLASVNLLASLLGMIPSVLDARSAARDAIAGVNEPRLEAQPPVHDPQAHRPGTLRP